jgi:DNA-binding NtrC family response regulator
MPLTARVLAATNRDLDAMVAEGTFRRDLFFRLSVVRLSIPPLRDRADDLTLLARHLLRDLAAASPRRVTGFTDAALDILRAYPWPGNARELRNVLEHALVLGDGDQIRPEDLPSAVRLGAQAHAQRAATKGAAESGDAAEKGRSVTLPANLDWLERQAIEAALEATGGNQRQAAAILGINRVTLHRKIKA